MYTVVYIARKKTWSGWKIRCPMTCQSTAASMQRYFSNVTAWLMPHLATIFLIVPFA